MVASDPQPGVDFAVSTETVPIVSCHGRRTGEISRRRLLWLGGAGLAATVAPIALPPTTRLHPLRTRCCAETRGALPLPAPGGRPHTLNRMTVHHTEVVLGDNSQRACPAPPAPALPPGHARVDRHCLSLQCRPPREHLPAAQPRLVGDTATSYDPTGHFLVVCEGNFDEEEVTEEQLNGAALVLAWAAQQFDIPTETLAVTETFSSNTTCPGASLYEHVTSGDLQSRVDYVCGRRPSGLPTICGPRRRRSSPRSKRGSASCYRGPSTSYVPRRRGTPPELCRWAPLMVTSHVKPWPASTAGSSPLLQLTLAKHRSRHSR